MGCFGATNTFRLRCIRLLLFRASATMHCLHNTSNQADETYQWPNGGRFIYLFLCILQLRFLLCRGVCTRETMRRPSSPGHSPDPSCSKPSRSASLRRVVKRRHIKTPPAALTAANLRVVASSGGGCRNKPLRREMFMSLLPWAGPERRRARR